jgi:hypothetical protein
MAGASFKTTPKEMGKTSRINVVMIATFPVLIYTLSGVWQTSLSFMSHSILQKHIFQQFNILPST